METILESYNQKYQILYIFDWKSTTINRLFIIEGLWIINEFF